MSEFRSSFIIEVFVLFIVFYPWILRLHLMKTMQGQTELGAVQVT